MRAAFYERNGTARDVLRVGEVDTPQAGPGEVRVKLATSGVNPSDVKSRQGLTRKIAWPRVIPDVDGPFQQYSTTSVKMVLASQATHLVRIETRMTIPSTRNKPAVPMRRE